VRWSSFAWLCVMHVVRTASATSGMFSISFLKGVVISGKYVKHYKMLFGWKTFTYSKDSPEFPVTRVAIRSELFHDSSSIITMAQSSWPPSTATSSAFLPSFNFAATLAFQRRSKETAAVLPDQAAKCKGNSYKR